MFRWVKSSRGSARARKRSKVFIGSARSRPCTRARGLTFLMIPINRSIHTGKEVKRRNEGFSQRLARRCLAIYPERIRSLPSSWKSIHVGRWQASAFKSPLSSRSPSQETANASHITSDFSRMGRGTRCKAHLLAHAQGSCLPPGAKVSVLLYLVRAHWHGPTHGLFASGSEHANCEYRFLSTENPPFQMKQSNLKFPSTNARPFAVPPFYIDVQRRTTFSQPHL